MAKRPVPALVSIAIRPSTPEDVERLNVALRQLTSETGGLRVTVAEETGVITVGASDEQQLELIVDRLAHEFKLRRPWASRKLPTRRRSPSLQKGPGALLSVRSAGAESMAREDPSGAAPAGLWISV
jgi:Elongation Factor G, domain III